VDQSNDRKSREFVQALANSQYFGVTEHLQSQAEAITAIDSGKVRAALIIPPRFATNTDEGGADVLILLDGSDSASVQSGYTGASLVAQSYALQLIAQKVVHSGNPVASAALTSLPITTSTRVLYNPNLTD